MRRREREREQSCIKKARREGSGWLCARSASPLPARPTDRPTFNLHFLSRRRRYRFVSPLSLPPLSLFVVYQDAWLKFPCHGQLHRQQFSFSHIRVHLRSIGKIFNFRSGQSVPGGGFFPSSSWVFGDDARTRAERLNSLVHLCRRTARSLHALICLKMRRRGRPEETNLGMGERGRRREREKRRVYGERGRPTDGRRNACGHTTSPCLRLRVA